MANVARLGGFKPVKHLNGSPYNGQANLYEIVAGDGTAVNVGDLVKADAGTATTVYPTCIRYAASGQVTSGLILGAVVGIVPDPTNLNTPQYRAASTKRLVWVADSPDLIFDVADGGTVPCTLTLIGMNTGVTATAPDTTTGVSPMATGTTAPTTTNTLPIKIVGIVDRADNESAAASQRLLVMINQHYFMGGQTAV
jgi:hypothetical protein